MDLDQELCLCFHVSLRKVQKFIRLEEPKVASQLSQCYGAGTGCGWCRPFLEKLLQDAQANSQDRPTVFNGLDRGVSATTPADHGAVSATFVSDDLPIKRLDQMGPDEYAVLREQYVRDGKGTPPR